MPERKTTSKVTIHVSFLSAVMLQWLVTQIHFSLLETRQVTPNNKDTWQGEVISAAINPAMLRCLRKHAGLFNTFIEATCGIGHWYSAKHMCYNDDFKETVYEKKLGITLSGM